MTKIYRPIQPVAVSCIGQSLIVRLANGHVVFAPLADFRSLADATPEQLAHYEVSPLSIYWPDLDDGIDVDWLLDHVGYKPDAE